MAGDYVEDRWYLSPQRHIISFVIYVGFSLILLKLTKQWEKNRTYIVVKPREFSPITKFFCGFLTFTFILQVYYKVVRGFLFSFNLLFPCHVVTVLVLMVLYLHGIDYKKSAYLFNIVVHLFEFPFLALILPDTEDHKEGYYFLPFAFWAHHALLILLPIILCWNGHYKLDRRDYHFYRYSVSYSLLFCFCVQLPIALIIKHNINYMIAPPQPKFFRGEWYRDFCCVGLIWGLWVSGCAVPTMIDWIRTKGKFCHSFDPSPVVIWDEERDLIAHLNEAKKVEVHLERNKSKKQE